jgi:hypothetical protein
MEGIEKYTRSVLVWTNTVRARVAKIIPIRNLLLYLLLFIEQRCQINLLIILGLNHLIIMIFSLNLFALSLLKIHFDFIFVDSFEDLRIW